MILIKYTDYQNSTLIYQQYIHIHTTCIYKISDLYYKYMGIWKDLLVKMQVNSVYLCYFPAGFSKIKTSKGQGTGDRN